MAEQPPDAPYHYSSEITTNSLTGIHEEEDYDDDDKIDNSSYGLIQQPSIFYNYTGRQHLSPPVSSSAGITFNLPSGGGDDDVEPGSLNITPLTPVPIQRVSSEDELKLCLKYKRAKFVGPYLFGDVIGQGSYAKVKECLDRRNLCRRAVKIMQRRRLRKIPQGEKMAATEIRILKKLNHPNIIKLYDFIRNDEKQKLYLFIDLCVVSLQEMLDSNRQQNQSKPFPTWQAHGYFLQLINGLEYLHSKFIIHNDIKPGNLLITIDHQLKITDFGTAEQLDLFSSDDTIKRSQGTPAFQCPEIANGDDTYSGFCIDVWSCGVTLFNLVTGRLPFEDNNIYVLFQTIGRGYYTIPDDIDPYLESLLKGLLQINKTLRLTIEQIKQHDWFRRRPPRTFEFLPFPPLALSRFQKFTMYDYLAELHQPSTDDNGEKEPDNLGDGSINVGIFPSESPEPSEQQQTGLSRFLCGCNRPRRSYNVHQRKTSDRRNHRLCSLS